MRSEITLTPGFSPVCRTTKARDRYTGFLAMGRPLPTRLDCNPQSGQ